MEHTYLEIRDWCVLSKHPMQDSLSNQVVRKPLLIPISSTWPWISNTQRWSYESEVGNRDMRPWGGPRTRDSRQERRPDYHRWWYAESSLSCDQLSWLHDDEDRSNPSNCKSSPSALGPWAPHQLFLVCVLDIWDTCRDAFAYLRCSCWHLD